MTPPAPRCCLFGAAGLRNLGVAALRTATVGALAVAAPEVEITVFDDGWGVRDGEVPVGPAMVPVTLCGARRSRRWHRRESYANMRISAALGGLGNPGVARIDRADVVLDVSAGDSFSDLYGATRFRTVVWPKRLALLRRRPLVLLPQTYGPFREAGARKEAAELVRRSAMAWARDPDSFAAMRDLLGADFAPQRHREGVDLAFALPPRPPAPEMAEPLLAWLRAHPGPVVGINVSGLVAAAGATAQFAMRSHPYQVVQQLCERLLAEPDVRILLVPHVRPGYGGDDDESVTARLHATLAAAHRERVAVAPPDLDPGQAKWVISGTDWFVGMRMHATIAALSTGVPVANIAYSPKARGVFATVGQERHVADTRKLTNEELLSALWSSWSDRSRAAAELSHAAPAAAQRAQEQVREIVDLARERRHQPAGRT